MRPLFSVKAAAMGACTGSRHARQQRQQTVWYVQFATAAGARMMDAMVGASAEDIAAIHPPAVQLALSLGNVSVPGQPQPIDFTAATSLECVPTPAFGTIGEVRDSPRPAAGPPACLAPTLLRCPVSEDALG